MISPLFLTRSYVSVTLDRHRQPLLFQAL